MKSREIEHIEIQNRLRGSVLIQEREYHIYIYIYRLMVRRDVRTQCR